MSTEAIRLVARVYRRSADEAKRRGICDERLRDRARSLERVVMRRVLGRIGGILRKERLS